MATGATDMMLRCVFYGSLSVYNTESEWRPYHRNCRCALHKLKHACPNASFQQGSISFPINQLRNDFSLSIAISSSSQTSFLADSIVRPKEDTNAASSRGHKNYEVMLEWEASLLISYSSIPVNLWIKSGREELWTCVFHLPVHYCESCKHNPVPLSLTTRQLDFIRLVFLILIVHFDHHGAICLHMHSKEDRHECWTGFKISADMLHIGRYVLGFGPSKKY